MSDTKKIARRDQILQTLARMLEVNPGERITTAALAAEVGVSEAALYRHFPSKAKMYEALIEFIEKTLFSRISRIVQQESDTLQQCEAILSLTLTFAERNPGLCRLLAGDALTGENQRLRHRISQLFDRIELQLKQLFKQGELATGLVTSQPAAITANLLLAYVEGKIAQYVRSGFRKSPHKAWADQWQLLSKNLLSEQRY